MKFLERLVINLLIFFPFFSEEENYWLPCNGKYRILDYNIIEGIVNHTYQVCTKLTLNKANCPEDFPFNYYETCVLYCHFIEWATEVHTFYYNPLNIGAQKNVHQLV